MTENRTKINNLFIFSAAILAAVYIISLTVSPYLLKDGLKICILAVIISFFGAIGGFLPIFIAYYRNKKTISLLILSNFIRLLLNIAGVVIILTLLKNNTIWFIGWLFWFYIVILILEIRLAISIYSCFSQE